MMLGKPERISYMDMEAENPLLLALTSTIMSCGS